MKPKGHDKARRNPEDFPVGRIWASLWDFERTAIEDIFKLHGPDKARAVLDRLAEQFFKGGG